MTSRGNQSVSPPAQIPQQRHVNAISSSTPPPQQYYTGPSTALSQGGYEFLPQAQSQPFNPYQAYGSALSDTRGQPGNSGRGVPPQQNLQQGGNFYQQQGPAIRPQQTPQSHTYFISAQPQGNLRPPRPTHQSASQMMFIPQNFTPRNSVITLPANVYQSARVPMFQPYVQSTPYPTNIVYYQNGTPAWQGGPAMAPTAAAAIRPQVREKRVLSIQDPDTGRDITEELLNSRSHSTSTEEHHEEVLPVNQNDKDICQTFTRLVADRLKSPDDSNTSGASSESHVVVSGAPVSSSGAVSASQQYQQPPPQQQQQPTSIAPAAMMRPPPSIPHHIPPRSGLIQQPPASTAPPHDIQHQMISVNFTMPPPQFPLRQPTQAIYTNVQQQHLSHHVNRHQQPPQQPVRSQMPPVIAPLPQQDHIQAQPPQQSVPNPPTTTTNDSTLQPHKAEPCVPDKEIPQTEATSQNNIPAGPPAPATTAARPSSPVKEVTTAPPQTVTVVEVKPSSVKTPADNEEVNIAEKVESVRVETSQGGGSQVVKDGRKGKKGKKDFICKEIGGSDMDAFIDSTQNAKSNPRKTSPGSDSVAPSHDREVESGAKISAQTSAKNVLQRDPKNPWKVQPAPEAPSVKRENPWAVRGPEPAETKLSVSTSSAPETSGVKESSNPWKILPVITLSSSVANPLKDSKVMKRVSNPAQDVKHKKIVVSISDPVLDLSVISTLPNPKNVTSLTSTLAAHQTSSSKHVKTKLKSPEHNADYGAIVPQDLTRNLAHSAQSTKYKNGITTQSTAQTGNENISKKSVNTGFSVGAQVVPQLSQNLHKKVSTISHLYQNPWHRSVPASTSIQCIGKEKIPIINSVKKPIVKVSLTQTNSNHHVSKNLTASTVCSSVQHLLNSTDCRGSSVQHNHNNLTSVPELRCTKKPPRTPCVAAVVSASSDLECSTSTKINFGSSLHVTKYPTIQPQEQKQNTALEKTAMPREMNTSTLQEGTQSEDAETTPSKAHGQLVVSQVDGANSGAGENNMTRTNNALDIAPDAGSSGIPVPQKLSGLSGSKDPEAKKDVLRKEPESAELNVPEQASELSAAVALEVGFSRDDSPNPQKNPEQQKQATTGAQVQNVESKHKQKKKKKKGRKTPPNQKVKPCTSSNDNSETQQEAVEVDSKPTLSQPVAVRKNSLDKPAVQEFKTPPTSSIAAQETPKVTKELLPQLSAPVSPALPTQQPEVSVDKNVTAAPLKENTVVEDNTVTVSESVSTNTIIPTKLDNQQQIEQTGSSVRSNRRFPGQMDRQSSKPLENGIPDIIRKSPVPAVTSNITHDSSELNCQIIGSEDELFEEHVSDQRGEDTKKGQLHATNNEALPTKTSSEKSSKVKTDGKEKLQYDRAYLMELRECASSQAKPEGLPDLEIILDRPVMNTNRGPGAAPPTFFQPSASQRHAPQIGKTNSRNRPRSDVQIPQRVIKSVSLQDSVKPLHQSEKPWKPNQKQSGGELADKKTLESEVFFIMNRLTPTNFERLAGEMKKLNIKTYEDLQELVKIFFDKVTMETKFVEAYANLCKVMCALKVQPPASSGIKENQATFRVVMLTKCQQEFEADKTVVFEDPEEKRKKIEAEMPEGPDRNAQIENTLYQMKLKRLKFYGNIRFIGELFKLGMLTENIMHDCIYRLLKARDDDSLVSLCNLITTVGQALDTDKAKTRMDQYFAQMAKIAEERKSRIKFTLKDAIDLRSNNWVPRKETTGPKKIDEVHKDFQEEQATKQFLQNQPLPPRSDVQQPNSRRGSRQRQDENKLLTDDGWNTVGSKSLRIDASKMKLSKNVVDENSIQLGPGGGMKQFSMWSRGSNYASQSSQDNDRSGTPTNRFSALRGEEDPRHYQRSPSRGDNAVANRGMRQGPTAGHGRGKILARSSQEGDRRDALASARSIVGGRSQNSSRDNSWNREDRRQITGPRGSRESENTMTRSDIILRPSIESLLPPSAVSSLHLGAGAAGYDDDLSVKKLKPLSEDEMGHKAKTILEEYLSVMDLEEAKLCLRELSGQQHLHIFVTTCINEVLERSTKERDLTGSFFHEMIKHGQLHMDVYLKGLTEALQLAEDFVIDIPMMWTYLAQIIIPMLMGGSLPWSSLPAVLKPLSGNYSAKLVAEVLLLAKGRASDDEVALLWQSNGLNWTAFLPVEEVDRFLKDKKLEFTVSPVSKSAGYSQIDLLKLSEDIDNIVRRNGPGSEILAYIDARFPVERQDRHFIRTLVTALINASVSKGTMKLNEDVIKSNKEVLQRCIKSNAELELQALYAIQALMHKLEHPSGVIATIFAILYEEEIISEETFKQWEKSADPQELEGKGACYMQLTQFFTWLLENEEPETS